MSRNGKVGGDAPYHLHRFLPEASGIIVFAHPPAEQLSGSGKEDRILTEHRYDRASFSPGPVLPLHYIAMMPGGDVGA